MSTPDDDAAFDADSEAAIHHAGRVIIKLQLAVYEYGEASPQRRADLRRAMYIARQSLSALAESGEAADWRPFTDPN